MPDNLPRNEIAAAVRVWLDGPPGDMDEAEYCRLVVFLWERCEDCAQDFATYFPGVEAWDLASEYLWLIKREKRHRPYKLPHNRRDLDRHMRHVLMEALDPARKELWELLSETLWAMEKDAVNPQAVCLGGTAQGQKKGQRNNTSFTQWIDAAFHRAAGGHPPPADLSAFGREADKLPHFYPPGATGWHAALPRVIAPEDARTLAAGLLRCARGWVTMGDLFFEFRRHVHLLEFVAPPESADGEAGDDSFVERQAAQRPPGRGGLGVLNATAEGAFWTAVASLAAKVWRELEDKGLGRVACQYVLAKALLGRKTTLADLGDTSTVFDDKKKVLAIFQQVLLADDLAGEGSEIAVWQDQLWAEVMRLLAHSEKFCNLGPENSGSGDFKTLSP